MFESVHVVGAGRAGSAVAAHIRPRRIFRAAAAAGTVALISACAFVAQPSPSSEIDLDTAIPAVPGGIGGAELEAVVAAMERRLGAEVTAHDPLVMSIGGISLTVRGDPVTSVAFILWTEDPKDIAPRVERLLPFVRQLTGLPQDRLDEAMALVEAWDGSEDLVHDERADGYRVFAWAQAGALPSLNLRIQGAD